MNKFDYFRKQKENALTSSYDIMLIVIKHANEIFDQKSQNLSDDQIQEHFFKFLKVYLIFHNL